MSEQLSAAERATLREMSSYEYYTFRQATCRKLKARGLAKIVPEGGRIKVRPGYRITAAGRAALTASEQP